MRIDVPQPEFPEIAYVKGGPLGMCQMTIFTPSVRGEIVTYEMHTVGDADAISEPEAAKLASMMKSFADKRGMSVDVSAK